MKKSVKLLKQGDLLKIRNNVDILTDYNILIFVRKYDHYGQYFITYNGKKFDSHFLYRINNANLTENEIWFEIL